MKKIDRCPTELKLHDYLEKRLCAADEEEISNHVAQCEHCLSLIALAGAAGEQPTALTREMINKAKDIAGIHKPRNILSHKWQILSAISFSLSFIVPRYFLQLLTLAVIFSLKWILDTGSTRTLIMIYEAWRKKDGSTAEQIIRDFKERIPQKR